MVPPMHSGLRPTSVANRDESSPSCNLGVVWESPWQEFASSLRDFFVGPKPLKGADPALEKSFRVDWVQDHLPGQAFTASSLWHIAVILILILPIWGFLPQPEHTLLPLQIEVTYVPAQDLPAISLPARRPKPPSRTKASSEEIKPAEQNGADAYHPRQTILATPVEITHPRQTLVQPDAPKTAPKIDAQLPNMVQWASPAPLKPQLRVSLTAATPTARQRVVRDVAVPEVANTEKNAAEINIAATSVLNPHPQLPLMPTSTAVALHRQARTDTAAAPEVAAASSNDDLHRMIALSAAPAPPAPQISVPQENLAARVSLSPEGRKPGTPGGAERTAATGGGTLAGASSPSAVAGAGGSLPAAVSVSGGSARAGAVAPAASAPGKLNLKPAGPDFTAPTRKGPSVVGTIDPSVPPEKILSGKEVHTLNINLPNLTSSAGSWVLNFAQLDETDGPPSGPKGQISGPVPIEKMDPKYPPQLIKEHVEGEVILYAIIAKDGSVRGIQLVHGIEPELDKDAMDALGHWKFRPGARDGVPVDLEAVIYIPFRYRPPQ
jgi:TonB family protein